MYGYIYKTTNLINGKFYIGKRAKSKFDESYYGSGKVLRLAIEKYGKENFKREVLEWCETKEQLSERERYWIKELNALNKQIAYNINTGGDGGGTPGKHKWTEEGLNNIIKANSHPHTEEHNKKIKDSCQGINKGRKQSQEAIQKYIESRKRNAKPNPAKGRKRTDVVWNKGLTKDTDERVRKNIENRTKTVHEKGTYAGKNNPFYGKHHSDESKEKNRKAHLGNKAHNEGKRCINNGIVNKYINIEALSEWEEKGFVLGCIKKVK